MVSDVAYSIVVARTFLREMQKICLEELRGAIPSLRVARASTVACMARPWRFESG